MALPVQPTPTAGQRRPVSASMRRRAVAAAAIGNAIEWYDYTIYGFLAATIAVLFFPADDPAISMLATFAAFALSFIVRPIGGIIFGSLGDRLGRQKILAIVVILISASTAAMGLLPSHAAIGAWAPLLLVLLRILQGLSAGGEIGGATAFLAEYAPDDRRAFQVGWINMSALPGSFAAAGIVTTFLATLPDEAMLAWGWRVPFLIAAPLGLIGFYLRRKIEDTPEFLAIAEAGEISKNPLKETLVNNARPILICLGLATTHAVGFYTVLTYIPNYLALSHGYNKGGALLMAMVSLVVAVAAIPFTTRLADRFGRRPVIAAAAIGYAVLAYPIYFMLSTGSLASIIVAQILLGALFGTYAGAPFSAMIELFATRVRYTAFSIGYNVATAMFGGTAAMISTWLVSTTGMETSPAFYLIAAAIVSLVAVAFAPETARRPLRQE